MLSPTLLAYQGFQVDFLWVHPFSPDRDLLLSPSYTSLTSRVGCPNRRRYTSVKTGKITVLDNVVQTTSSALELLVTVLVLILEPILLLTAWLFIMTAALFIFTAAYCVEGISYCWQYFVRSELI